MVDLPLKSFVVSASYIVPLTDSASFLRDIANISTLPGGAPVSSQVLAVSPYYVQLRCPYFDFDAGIQESVASEYGSIAILGRAQGVKIFVSTANREFPLTFKFMYQSNPNDDAARSEDISDQVVRPARWLESLAFPQVDLTTGRSYPPPRVEIQFGDLLRVTVVTQQVGIRWYGGFDYDMSANDGSMLPHCAEVSCHFTEVSSIVSKDNANLLNIAGIYA